MKWSLLVARETVVIIIIISTFTHAKAGLQYLVFFIPTEINNAVFFKQLVIVFLC